MPSNLPPGVTDNMIPGNRPEDVAHEKAMEIVLEAATTLAEMRWSLGHNWRGLGESQKAKEWYNKARRIEKAVAYIVSGEEDV